MIQFRTPVTHGEIKMKILGCCGVRVGGRHVENCPVVVSAVYQDPSGRGVCKPSCIDHSGCVHTCDVKNQRFPFRCVHIT